MPEGLDPIANSDAYLTLYLGGIGSPGVVTFSGIKDQTGWDVKQGRGTTGATITWQGNHKIIEFKAKFTLWTQDHFYVWERWRKFLRYDPAKNKSKPIQLDHPILADANIRACVTAEISQLQGGERGAPWFYEVTFIPYRPPTPAKATTPSGAAGHYIEKNDAKPAPTAQTLQDKRLAELLAQAGKPYP